ncbi:hypothetical protein P3T76_016287 [Phytophthora citrophthora]|uniref:Uncharacterized protein n=1 Tax=Phytophthora citrophthora TaxID=4793 RepID=A0AAD9FXV0_9STRA|nr:hypothetical protein P3T76_016287 [Phytophthora citrophthora]
MCPCLSVLAFLTLAIHCCTWLRGLGASLGSPGFLGFWVSGFLGFWAELIENTLYVRAAANRAPPPPCLSVLAFLTLAIHCCTWLRGLGASLGSPGFLGFWVSGFLGFWAELIENTLYVRAAANRAPPPPCLSVLAFLTLAIHCCTWLRGLGASLGSPGFLGFWVSGFLGFWAELIENTLHVRAAANRAPPPPCLSVLAFLTLAIHCCTWLRGLGASLGSPGFLGFWVSGFLGFWAELIENTLYVRAAANRAPPPPCLSVLAFLTLAIHCCTWLRGLGASLGSPGFLAFWVSGFLGFWAELIENTLYVRAAANRAPPPPCLSVLAFLTLAIHCCTWLRGLGASLGSPGFLGFWVSGFLGFWAELIENTLHVRAAANRAPPPPCLSVLAFLTLAIHCCTWLRGLGASLGSPGFLAFWVSGFLGFWAELIENTLHVRAAANRAPPPPCLSVLAFLTLAIHCCTWLRGLGASLGSPGFLGFWVSGFLGFWAELIENTLYVRAAANRAPPPPCLSVLAFLTLAIHCCTWLRGLGASLGSPGFLGFWVSGFLGFWAELIENTLYVRAAANRAPPPPCLSVLAFLTLAIHCCTWLRGLGASLGSPGFLGFWVSGFLGFWAELIENTLYVRAAANRAPPPPCLSVLAFLTLAIHCCTWLRGLGASLGSPGFLGFWVSGFLGFWVLGFWAELIENTLYVRAAANRAPPPPCLSVLAFLTLAIHCCTWLRGLGASLGSPGFLGFWVSGFLGFWVSGFLGFFPMCWLAIGLLAWPLVGQSGRTDEPAELIENTLYVRAAANRAPPPPCLSVLAFLTLAIHCCTWLRGLGASLGSPGFLAFWLSGFLAFWVSGFLGSWVSGFVFPCAGLPLAFSLGL